MNKAHRDKLYNCTSLAVIGLGYVGLPLALAFSKKKNVIGFDINKSRVKELGSGFDSTLEVTKHELELTNCLHFTSNVQDLVGIDCFVVTVPTPIDRQKNPDLSALKQASKIIGDLMNECTLIIYESTVFPGATEEICVPILERASGLKYNQDFYCGYSPERINPGDKEHRLVDIKKVTSGSTPATADVVDSLYKQIVNAGTFKVSSIKVAEAAKVIENTQRDLNIALINECALIFEKLSIDTEEVLQAAETKWNFLPFRPGLVGGHCIGIDPYYLTFKAKEIGFFPEVILAGRRLNDSMGGYVVDQVTKLMTRKRINIIDANILIMGLSFKENCPDFRNTGVINIINGFNELNCNVEVYDPWVSHKGANCKHPINLVKVPKKGNYDAIVLAVCHSEFKSMGVETIRSFGKSQHVLFDVKYLFAAGTADGRL